MTPEEHLSALENTDWSALVKLAMSDPPQPGELVFILNRWAALFQLVRSKKPQQEDFPKDVAEFFERLALAEIPPDVQPWMVTYKVKHGRWPTRRDIPKHLRDQLPKSGKGRPRCDTARMLIIKRAWIGESYRQNYDSNREMISNLSARKERRGTPSDNAVDQISYDSDDQISKDMIWNTMFPRNRK